MAIFKCKMCGGSLEIIDGTTVVMCEYCGTKQTLPRLADEKKANMYDRANHFRRNNEFDKAMGIYEQILNDDSSDAESYWSIVLCRYGIEYVEDPVTHKRIPTVNRAQFTSVFDDEDYKSALQHADANQRNIYEQEATLINNIQKGILAISSQEEPFDVFICYKETDNNGRRTPDSVLATELYHELTREGYKVFFSRITLEDKLGTAYEPYIFAALNSSKVMVVLGTKAEYFNAVWVKNEWSRYLALIKNGARKMLIPAYKDMDPYNLPEEFSHLQAQDMSKLGFMQDLIRGIKKIVDVDSPKQTIKETIIANDSAGGNYTALIKRGYMALEDGEWQKADEFFEQALNQNAEIAEAYLGKLMAEFNIRTEHNIKDCAVPFDSSSNYHKTIRFADKKLKSSLEDSLQHIKERNKEAALADVYQKALHEMSHSTENGYRQAKMYFDSIAGYRDADSLAIECENQAEIVRKNILYNKACEVLSESYGEQSIVVYENAMNTLLSLGDWKDAPQKADECSRKIAELQELDAQMKAADAAREEKQRLEKEQQKELDRLKAIERKKKNKKIAIIVAACIFVAILGLGSYVGYINVYVPYVKYSAAVELMESGNYNEATIAFKELNGFYISNKKIEECELCILEDQYVDAVALMNDKKYKEAIIAFKKLDGYKDSSDKITECNNVISDEDYNAAVALMNEGNYKDAIKAFNKMKGYKDSDALIETCLSELIVEVRVSTAQELLENIGSYKKIILTSSYYDLSYVSKVANAAVSKLEHGFKISGVQYLTITGESSIVIDDYLADVLEFYNCSNIVLQGLTVGHKQINKEYRCDGAVVSLDTCRVVSISNCNLFGCGSIGLNVHSSSDVSVKDSDIYECNFAGISARSSKISVSNCRLYDFVIDEYGGLILSNGSTLDFKECSIKNAEAEILINIDDYMGGSSSLQFLSCTITNNNYSKLTTDQEKITFTNCTINN